MASWNNLPGHVLEKVFENCDHKDLKILSLVSWDWSERVNLHWRKNSILDIDKISPQTVESLKLSRKRRYDHVKIFVNKNINLLK